MASLNKSQNLNKILFIGLSLLGLSILFLTRSEYLRDRILLNKTLLPILDNVFLENERIDCFSWMNAGLGSACIQNSYLASCSESDDLLNTFSDENLKTLAELDLVRARQIMAVNELASKNLLPAANIAAESLDSADQILAFMYGNLLLALNREEGFTMLRSVPNANQYYVFKGKSALANKDTEEAMLCFQEANSITPDPLALYYLGETYLVRGETELARKSYERLKSFGNQSVPINASDRPSALFLSLKGIGETAYELENWPEAVEIYEQAMQIDDTDPTIYLRLAWSIYQHVGAVDEAMQYLDKAVGLNQNSIWPAITAGRIFEAEERLSEAQGAYETAVKIDPNSGLAHYYLSQILYQEGLELDAITEMERALTLDSGNDAYRTRLCRWYADLEMTDAYQATCN